MRGKRNKFIGKITQEGEKDRKSNNGKGSIVITKRPLPLTGREGTRD